MEKRHSTQKTHTTLADTSQRKEDNQLEAKSAKGGIPDSMWDTYSAFANTEGGTIVLGVKERKDKTLEITGVDDAYKMKTDIWNMLNNRMKVSINLMTEQRVRIETIEGRDIVVLDVPRADRSSRPVYKGPDPRNGTYRRNGEGDYLCSNEEISAMYRDASLVTQDAKVLTEMDTSVFCEESVKAYRQIFSNIHTNHSWNKLEDEIFLRCIGAMGVGSDGNYHPTAAGLLMFGYEYEITREYPQYFLDYQEHRQAATTRWTDRIVSTSGEWSGNVFDFMLRIVPKLTADLKKPFVLKGMTRIDDTPVHKALREATTNACVHADFYGRQGLVVQKQSNGFRFSNPGALRIARDTAIEGGVSDPRNGQMLKMFSLIDYGERAGSGLSTICQVWEKVFHRQAELNVQTGVDRFTLYLPGQAEEEDVQAMLQLYDTPDELTFGNATVKEYGTETTFGNTEMKEPEVPYYKRPPKKQKDKQKSIAEQLVEFCIEPRTLIEIAEHFGVKDRYYFKRTVMKPLLGKTIFHTNENAPSSPLQKYYSKQ